MANKKVRMGQQLNKLFLFIILGGLIILIIAFVYSSSKKQLPILGEPGHNTGSFSFINQDGKIITDKDVNNKVRIVEYFFTTCKGICPVMNNNLQEVQDTFKDDNDVIILSHTVDPDVDNPDVLKAYAKKIHAMPGKWEFLTGEKYALYKMAQQDYLLSADTTMQADNSFIHTQYITLVDKQNHIRGFYDATDKDAIKKLVGDIKGLE